MAESKKVIIVGIPGVGKTTLVSKIVEILKAKQKSISVHSFGTVMLEEAKKMALRIEMSLENFLWKSKQIFKKWLRKKLLSYKMNL